MRLFIDDYLQVRYVNLKTSKKLNNLKIMAIGDLHISDMVSYKKIDLIKKRILAEKADYVFFVGDLIDSVLEIENEDSLSKLSDLLKFSVSKSKTFVILGNHDYIHRENRSNYLKDVKKVLKSIEGIVVLDNDIYYDDKIYLMGYTEPIDYYGKEDYNYKVFYDDIVRRDCLYKNVNKELFSIVLTHSPEFSSDNECISLLKDYDLIICGHTHDGCVPFGIGNFKRGIISPKKKFFPKNVRGLRRLKNNYILVTGGVVKIQECALKILHPFNHFCPMQLDVITFDDVSTNVFKKWY